MMSDQNDERTDYQSSEQKLCENQCGFFGSPATMNLCSKCFRESVDRQLQSNGFSKLSIEESPKLHSSIFFDDNEQATVTLSAGCTEETLVGVPPATSRTRCKRCKKKVRLNGFECRCGGTFCVSHRHREEHDCPFNIKAVGRETIAKDNPLMQADKLQRI